VDEGVYHVLNRGNGRQEVFHREDDYAGFVELIKKAKRRYAVKLFGYCLMPNHYHMVVMIEEAEELSRWMQWLMTSHVRRYHREHESNGHVWQGRYKSFVIESDDHLLTVMRYVEGNPVRAGLAGSAIEWRWSSHAEVIGKKERQIIDELPIDLPDGWSRYVDEPLTEKEIDRVRESVKRQCPYGRREWIAEVSSQFGLESTLRPRGRPKKK
jgi:putative transposase